MERGRLQLQRRLILIHFRISAFGAKEAMVSAQTASCSWLGIPIALGKARGYDLN